MQPRRPTVAIVDYSLGNLFSVRNACARVGLDASITSNKADVLNADAVILPGVGDDGGRPEGTSAYAKRSRAVRRLAYGPARAACRSGQSRCSAALERLVRGYRRRAPGRSATRSSPTRTAALSTTSWSRISAATVSGGQRRLQGRGRSAAERASVRCLRHHSLPDRALIALQGPKAESALAKLCAEATAMRFMDAGPRQVDDFDCFVSRSGYTGEDGFEISVPAEQPKRWRRRCSPTATCCRSASARATACGWRPGSVSMAMTSTLRRRRSRARWNGRSRRAAAAAAREPAVFPARRRSSPSSQLARHAAASA